MKRKIVKPRTKVVRGVTYVYVKNAPDPGWYLLSETVRPQKRKK